MTLRTTSSIGSSGRSMRIELTIDRVVAKRKLSQNRSEADVAGVIDGLRQTSERRRHDVADAMERKLP